MDQWFVSSKETAEEIYAWPVISRISEMMFANAFDQVCTNVGSYKSGQRSTIGYTFKPSAQSSSTDHFTTIDLIGRFRFKTDMCFDIESAGDGWLMLSNSDSRLYAIGRTIEEAKADLEKTLNDILDDYVLCDESELHESGIELKKWFIENVEVITQ